MLVTDVTRLLDPAMLAHHVAVQGAPVVAVNVGTDSVPLVAENVAHLHKRMASEMALVTMIQAGDPRVRPVNARMIVIDGGKCTPVVTRARIDAELNPPPAAA